MIKFNLLRFLEESINNEENNKNIFSKNFMFLKNDQFHRSHVSCCILTMLFIINNKNVTLAQVLAICDVNPFNF